MAREKSTGRRSDIRTKGRYDTLCHSQDLMCLKNTVIPASFGPENAKVPANSSFDWGQCDGLSL
jgi:hypothetical protein